ncbi:PAP2 family protein [Segatella oris F0302]|uniref:PAP2 family protein n=1 Tax=Segatella oris F0302 TaxID=649760 RepID=D1QT33_9BACT|nr:phosphatase PAP2 family protein [Segatella oris]EFB31486.1 PAP2 family protein [Segatella oris F0302]MBF1448708.1 phosphatase PAP2 family protein [Segatella oris]
MMTELTDLLSMLKAMDTMVFLTVNSHHNAYFDSVMWLVSGKLIWVPMYVSLFFVLLKNYSYKVVFAILLAIGVVILFTDSFTAQVIRPWVCRLRPSNLDNPMSSMVHVVDGYRGGAYGFPSNHASNTWGLAFFITFLFRRYKLTFFFFLWALLVCYSRMYLGVHYFGDLLIGALLALAGASTVFYVFRKVSGDTRLQKVKFIYWPVWIGIATFLVIMVSSIFYRV